MGRVEEVFLRLFTSLREDLREQSDIGLALKAEGSNLTLRIRSQRKQGDERQPFFAIVVGPGMKDGDFRITYKPSGLPSAESQVTILDAESTGDLLGLVRSYLDRERKRSIDRDQGG